MSPRKVILIAAIGVTGGLVAGRAAPAAGLPPLPGETAAEYLQHDPDTGEPRIDPTRFFELLVARYQRLSFYEDVTNVVQVTERDGEQPTRVETRIGCEVEDGRLHVETPAGQVRRSMGLDVGYRKTPALEAAAMRYKFWLAPHMALKFADEPRKALGQSGAERLRVADAAAVTIDDKTMVHVELRSGDGPAEECETTYDLYVNPESMLVERIKGQQRLPDGACYETTLEITTVYAENAPADDTPADDPPPGEGPSLPMPLVNPGPAGPSGVAPEPAQATERPPSVDSPDADFIGPPATPLSPPVS